VNQGNIRPEVPEVWK